MSTQRKIQNLLLIICPLLLITIIGCKPNGERATTSSISGVVTLRGLSDYSGAKVEIKGTGLSATTASNGSYSIGNIPVGTHTVIASKDFYENESRVIIITEAPLTNINFALTIQQPPNIPAKK